ncbi:DUF72 domain-containing protein [Pseudoxanthomonas sp. GW2]|uniref:DUF72 domain-containing protein n=1 Tax=Pseudoxanthomonas sp. GW2 TaxID=1211114 RepID=UPI0002DF4856|nr:DUF72 domain-containing protein [Pseudoxanthomonas sp. GW2]
MGAGTGGVRIGCAGWSIPGRHAALFGAGDSALARYATRFDVVEVNSSFYRPHQHAPWRRWAAAVPRGFRFSVKLPQEISHELGLRGAGPALDRFLEQVDGLGRKLGGFLLQLPPGLELDARSASAFFAMFRRRSDVPLACEPRHPGWFTPRAEDLLRRYDVARVAADPPRVPGGDAPAAAPRWRYWRWHGSPRIYYSDYAEPALRELATQVRAATGRGQRWVVFDNTAHGFAIPDAARLQELLHGDVPKQARG